jgi:hypothetical protein
MEKSMDDFPIATFDSQGVIIAGLSPGERRGRWPHPKSGTKGEAA